MVCKSGSKYTKKINNVPIINLHRYLKERDQTKYQEDYNNL